MSDDTDVLTVLARYAPHEMMADWSQTHADATLLAVLGQQPRTASADGPPAEVVLQPVPRRSPTRHRYAARVLPIAASVVVLAAVVVAAVLAGSGGSGGQAGGAGGQPFGPEFTPPKGLSNHALGRHEYAYSYVDQFDLGAAGRANRRGKYKPDAMRMRNYLAYDGTLVSFRTGSQHGCFRFADGNRTASVQRFASLPTDVGKLERYYRHHINGGSGSADGAVFSQISDDLSYDALASPRLRAAMLAVLSRTPGVRLHFDVRDYLGRRAIRADFVNPPLSGPYIESLYFDPTDFRLLESRGSDDGASYHYDEPSPVYTAAPPTTSDDPDRLGGPALIELTRVARVVHHAPSCN